MGVGAGWGGVALDLEYLREFAVFAKYMNMTKAAHELFISQPRLSQHMKALEAELGFPLMERKRGQKCKLTPAGSMFCASVQTMLRDYDDAVRRCEECASEASVSLTVSKPSLSVTQVFRQASQEYRQLYGQSTSVSISFKNCIGMDPLEIVDSHVVDASILYLFPKQLGQISQQYSLIRLRSEALCLFGPASDRFKADGCISVHDLNGVTLAFAGDIMHQVYYNAPLVEYLEQCGVKVIPTTVFTDDYDNFKMAYFGEYSLVPESWGQELAELSDAPTVLSQIADLEVNAELYLIYQPDLLSRTQQNYLKVLASTVDSGPDAAR